MRTLEEVIKLMEARIEVDEEMINECDLSNYDEKYRAQTYAKSVEWQKQITGWLKQLQEIKKTVREYRSVPVEDMDSDDAFAEICKIIDK